MVLGWMIPPPPSEKSHVVLINGIFAQGLGLGGCKNSSKNWRCFCRKIILKLLNKNASLGADIVHPNHLWELSHPTVPSLSGQICQTLLGPFKREPFSRCTVFPGFSVIHVPWIHPQQERNCRRKNETTSVPAKKNTPRKKHTNLVSFI